MTNQEADILIAEKVLGVKVLGKTAPRYSTSIAAAWLVLGELHKRGWFWRLDSVHDGVVLTLQNVERKTHQIRAPTAPAAIAEAALQIMNAADVPAEKA